MIKLGPVKDFKLTKIIGPGDLKKRQRTENVLQLAEGFKKYGRPFHPITLQKTKRGLEIVMGRDRYAAGSLAGVSVIPAQLVLKATPLELLEMEIEENLHRRDVDRDALVAELVRRAKLLLPQRSEADNLSGSTRGVTESPRRDTRARTEEGEAREVVAKAMGTTPEAVRAATKRDAKAREEAAREDVGNGAGAPAAQKPAPLPIEAHGRAFPAGWAPRVVIVQDALAAVDKASQAALRALSEVEQTFSDLKWRPAVMQRLREMAKALGAEARAQRPTDACPYCCDSDTQRETDAPLCKVCGGERTLTKEQAANVPAEVWSGESEAAIDRHIARAAKAVAPAKAKPAKRLNIVIVDADGKETPAEQPELTVERDGEVPWE
jgi:hypothetical protein